MDNDDFSGLQIVNCKLLIINYLHSRKQCTYVPLTPVKIPPENSVLMCQFDSFTSFTTFFFTFFLQITHFFVNLHTINTTT